MTTVEKNELIEFLEMNCDAFVADREAYTSRSWEVRDVKNAIGRYDPKIRECGETENRPDYESINEKLKCELDYWKSEHNSLREENMRLLAILRTVEQFTGKNLLDT